MAAITSKIPQIKRDASVADLPEPAGYFLLIHIPETEESTKGGVFLADETRKKEQYASPVAHIIKKGPLSYKDEKRFPTGDWCDVGDCVIIKPYAGRVFWCRIEDQDHEFRIIADDEVMAKVPRPDLLIRRT